MAALFYPPVSVCPPMNNGGLLKHNPKIAPLIISCVAIPTQDGGMAP